MQPSVHIGVRCFFLCLLAVGIAMLAGAGCADVRQSLREEYGEPDVIGEESGDLVRYYPPDDPPPPEYRWPASRTTTTWYYLDDDLAATIEEDGTITYSEIDSQTRELLTNVLNGERPWPRR